MQLKLILLTSDLLTIGKPTSIDLFNAQGQLLLAKGQVVTSPIMELLLNRKLYILEYEWKEPENKSRAFSPELYQKTLGAMQKIYSEARLVCRKTLLDTIDLVDSLVKELEEYGRYVDFNRFRTYDNYTYVHSINVSLLTTLIALQLGFRGNYLRNLTTGALLHDLGKLMVPVSILNKPSGLTPEEFEIVKRHPIQGEEMLRGVEVASEILLAIRQHHERWNGQGYPRRLIKRAIDPCAQIVAIADVFDALTADRPYRKGLPPYHAFEMIIAGAGIDFAPDVVHAFRRSLVLYPENSVVTLNTGEVGVVIAVPYHYPTRPLVRLLFDGKGNLLTDYRVIDLLQDLTHFITEVEFKVG